MRSRKALVNTTVQIILEIVTIISGFIVPRLIIGTFGSDTNGLVISITQFFGYLTVLQTGIGGVAKAALYKPLADNDIAKTSSLIKSIESFFQKIGYFSIAYLVILMIVFPVLIYPAGNTAETALLVLIIWLGVFSQYYFGLTYQFLLQADQRYYVFSFTQIAVVILNTILSVVMIKCGFSILMVKLVSSFIFFARPVFLSAYCKKKYSLDQRAVKDDSLLKQRWDGFGHTIAYFIHSKTDVFVLTIFSTLANVSVYSVYAYVTSGLSLLMNTVATSVQSAFGNMIARQERENIKKNYHAYVCFNNALVMILFSTAIITILPFMKLYTASFEYSGYIDGTFAFLLFVAEATYCIRMPYQTIVLAAGHYKQTRNGAFAEAGINIVISVCLVYWLGIIGVTIGTLVAMMIRTIQYIRYLSKNIVSEKPEKQYVWVIVDIVFLSAAGILSKRINTIKRIQLINSYLGWCIFAFIVFILMTILVVAMIAIIDKESFSNIIAIPKRIFRKQTEVEKAG